MFNEEELGLCWRCEHWKNNDCEYYCQGVEEFDEEKGVLQCEDYCEE